MEIDDMVDSNIAWVDILDFMSRIRACLGFYNGDVGVSVFSD